MGKERKRIILKRPGNSDQDIELLRQGVKNLNEKYPSRVLIFVKTPQITPQQLEDLFNLGADAWAKLASPEESPPKPPVK